MATHVALRTADCAVISTPPPSLNWFFGCLDFAPVMAVDRLMD